MVKRTPTGLVRISEDHKEKIIKIAQSSKIGQKEIAEYLIDLCLKFDLLKPGFENRLKSIDEQIKTEAYKKLDDPCPALAHTYKGFVCVIKPPAQKQLGDGSLGDMDEVCSACQRVKGIKTELDLLRTRVRNGATVSIPQCKRGGMLKEGNKMWCPITTTTKSIDMCKLKPCEHYTTTLIHLEGDLKKISDNL